MEFGAHLPLIDFGAGWSLPALKSYARAAAEFGFTHLCANDHLVFARPWLDGPTALAAVLAESRDMVLATTVSLPVIRGPAQLAKTLGALDVLSGGRLVVGVGPGSSPRDYALAGVPFAERWRRFDEAVVTLRQLLHGSPPDALEPRPLQPGGPPMWIGSWGSPAGLRRVASRGDGWLASAYNIRPDQARQCLARLRQLAPDRGDPFPHALATTWFYVADDHRAAERVLTELLAPILNRPADGLRGLPIGTPEHCAQQLTEFARAGVRRMFLWPLQDENRQLELFRDRVEPLIPTSS
jgi:alkanesulfonate monooxygenase SsuD/methylene tetrahydromethanopterin reductase-like flavin-dependent oxidoreductase (luciferase family)